MPDQSFFLASLGAFMVGLSKGGLPVVGMLSVPLLSLVMPPMQAAALLLPVYLISDVVGVWLYRRYVSVANLRMLVPAGLVGIAIGWRTVALVPDRAIATTIGLMGVAFCLHVWLRPWLQRGTVHPARPARTAMGWWWGMLSGFTSFIAHAGAPPFQFHMLPQRLPKMQFAGTATVFFAALNVAKVVPYQMLNPYTVQGLGEVATLVPPALVGTLAGAILTRRVSDTWFYRLVNLGLFAVSVKLMIG